MPATEMAPELGGWIEAYTPATDPAVQPRAGVSVTALRQRLRAFSAARLFSKRPPLRAESSTSFCGTCRAPACCSILAPTAPGQRRGCASRGLTCIALDITDHLSLAHLFHSACPRYALVNVDMHEPVSATHAFDAITAFNALHHSKRLDALATNIARC